MKAFETSEQTIGRHAPRRINLPSSIAGLLRASIERGDLRPGQQLPGHRELANMYSVSVGSVREAISMLVSEGLVTTRAGRGTFVVDRPNLLPGEAVRHPPDRQQVEELLEAREALEGHIVVLAAGRASEEQVARLRSVVERMEAAVSDAAAFLEADLEYHLALAEAAGNRFLLQAMTGIRSLLRRELELSAEIELRRSGNLRAASAEHRELVEGIAKGDADEAHRAILQIVNRNRNAVLPLYQPTET